MTIKLINSENAENETFSMYEGLGYPQYTHKPTGKTYNIYNCPKELLPETREFLKAVRAAQADAKAKEIAKFEAWEESPEGIADAEAMRRHQELMDEMNNPDSDI